MVCTRCRAQPRVLTLLASYLCTIGAGALSPAIARSYGAALHASTSVPEKAVLWLRERLVSGDRALVISPVGFVWLCMGLPMVVKALAWWWATNRRTPYARPR